MTIELNSVIFHKLTGEPMFVLVVDGTDITVRHYEPRTGKYIIEHFSEPEFDLSDPNSPEKLLANIFKQNGAEEIDFPEPKNDSTIKPA